MRHLYLSLFTLGLTASGTLFAQPALEWAVPITQRAGGSGYSLPYLEYPRLAAGSLGDIYFAGLAGGTRVADFSVGREQMVADGTDGNFYFVGQIDHSGHPAWVKLMSGMRGYGYVDTYTPYLLPLPSGGVQLVTTVQGPVVYGSDTLLSINAEDTKLLIAQIDAAGEITASSLLNWGQQDIDAVIRAADGDVLLAGRYRNFNDVLGNLQLAANSSPAYFIARLSPEGQVRWATSLSAAKEWGSLGNAYGLLETRSGAIAITLGPAGRQFTIAGCGDNRLPLQLAMLEGSTGEVRYLKELGRTRFGYLSDLAEAPNGDLYAAGSQGGGIWAANGETGPAADAANCNVVGGFVLKVDPISGQVQDLAARHNHLRGTRISFLTDGSYVVSGVGRPVESAEDPTTMAGAVLSHYDRYDQLLSSVQVTEYSSYRENWATVIGSGENAVYLSTLYEGTILGERQRPADFFGASMVVSRLNFPAAPSASGLPLRVFPNPLTDWINVYAADMTEASAFLLYDATGRQIASYPVVPNRTQHSLYLGDLPNGAYFLRLSSDKNARATTIIKQ